MSIIEELRQLKSDFCKHNEDVELAYEDIILALKARAANGFNYATINLTDFSKQELDTLKSRLTDAGFDVSVRGVGSGFVIKWV